MRKRGYGSGVLAIGILCAVAFAAVGAAVPVQVSDVPTFSKDVAPVLYKNCVSCHRPGAMAPMSLLTYADARPWARSIRARVEDATMPPWHADAPKGTFLNERGLTPAEKSTLVRWAGNGAPEGDSRDLPAAPAFSSGWTMGVPDAVLTMSQPFNVPASGTIPYQYFQVPTNFTEDKWVRSIEIRPGALSVVHHVLVFASDPGGRPRALPFSGTGAAGRGNLIATTAPGTNGLMFDSGAMRIPKGSILTFQIHYTAAGKAQPDRTSVGFVFAKEAPGKEIQSASFVNFRFTIPPGASDHRVDAQIEFTQNVHVLALFPHTHLRGKRWEYRLAYPDGREEVVLSVPRYDFNWQTYYQYAKPLAIPKGAKLLAIAHYDNSSNNKANPDPLAQVRWGDQTWEEMQYSGITYTVD